MYGDSTLMKSIIEEHQDRSTFSLKKNDGYPSKELANLEEIKSFDGNYSFKEYAGFRSQPMHSSEASDIRIIFRRAGSCSSGTRPTPRLMTHSWSAFIAR